MPKVNADVIRQMTRLFDEGTLAGLTEGQLLDRFLQSRDESAFEALVERHSPLVMGVCLKVLGNPHDAEDAFQATFLLLARKAGSVRHRKVLSGWLHRVAYRVASRSGRASSRRRAFEKPDSPTTETAVSPSPPSPDLARIVHEELARLSDNDRAAVVLCDLEGLTHSEAAARLNWPVGTVKGRLSRARDRLRLRLSRRGLTLPATLLASTLSIESKASVSRALMTSTAHAAALASAGHALSGTLSASALALATGVSRTMMLSQIKLFASLFLAGTLLAAGTGAVLLPNDKPSKADLPEPKAKAEADPPEPKAESEQTAEDDEARRLVGTWEVRKWESRGISRDGEADVVEMPGPLVMHGGGTWIETSELLRAKEITFNADGTCLFQVTDLPPYEHQHQYKLGMENELHTIDLLLKRDPPTFKGPEPTLTRGLFRISEDGQTLTLYASEGQRPKRFESFGKGNSTLLMTLTRKPDKPEAEQSKAEPNVEPKQEPPEAAVQAPEPKKDDPAKQIVGTWTLKDWELHGPGPKGELRVYDAGTPSIPLGTEITLRADGTCDFSYWPFKAYSVVPKTDFSEINLYRSLDFGAAPQIAVAPGIFRISDDGQTLTLYAQEGDDLPRPSNFEWVGDPKKNIGIWLLTFKRNPDKPAASKVEPDPILGFWKVLYAERDGSIQRVGFPGRPSVLRFDASGLCQIHEPVPSKTLRSLTKKGKIATQFTVHPHADPKQIDVRVFDESDKESRQPGIYRIDGDTMTLCLHSPDPDQPVAPVPIGGTPPRPRGFETSKDNHNLLLVLKRGTLEDFKSKTPEATNELVGTWKCVEFVEVGQRDPRPPEELGEVVILPGRIFWGENTRKVSEYVLNPNTSPKQIDLHAKEGNTLGIYERDGELLRFGISTTGPRPQSFALAGQMVSTSFTAFRYVGPPRAVDFEALDAPPPSAPAPEPPKAPDAPPPPQSPKPPAAEPLPTSDKARIQGRWDVKEMDGWNGEEVQHLGLEGQSAHFGPESATLPELSGNDLPDRPMFRMFYTLEPRAFPKTIDLELGSTTRRGIYKISPNGTGLYICLGTRGSPRPTDFQGDLNDAVLYHLTRRASETAKTQPPALAPEREPELPPAPAPESPKPEAKAGKARQTRDGKRAPEGQPAKPAPGISREEHAQLLDQLEQARNRETSLEEAEATRREALERFEQRVGPLERYVENLQDGEKVNRALAKLMLGDDAEAFAVLSEDELRQVLETARDARDRAANELEQTGASLREVRDQIADVDRKLGAPLAEPRKIKPGDILLIEVLEALPGRPITGERVVRPDGTISLGFYGDLPVAGLDRYQIKEQLVEHLRKFLSDDVLGLVGEDEKGQRVSIPPADSDRVFVDDSVLDFRNAVELRSSGSRRYSGAAGQGRETRSN